MRDKGQVQLVYELGVRRTWRLVESPKKDVLTFSKLYTHPDGFTVAIKISHMGAYEVTSEGDEYSSTTILCITDPCGMP